MKKISFNHSDYFYSLQLPGQEKFMGQSEKA